MPGAAVNITRSDTLCYPILCHSFCRRWHCGRKYIGIPTRYTATLCALVLPLLLTAITTSLVALLALRLGSSKRGAYLAAIGYAFGTTAIVYSREFFAEPLLALLTTASIYLALGKTYREQTGASILAGLAITAKPAGIVIGPLVSFLFFVQTIFLANRYYSPRGDGGGHTSLHGIQLLAL